jgi:phytoene dehydrogenase-like protein
MKVVVVGGGLAGMVAALRLAERGCQVGLYESNHRFGGKAGADKRGDDYDEHGYHIFPLWYRNIWALVDELGIRDNFEDVEAFHQLYRGDFPETRTLANLGSIHHVFRNIFAGVMSPAEMTLFFYSALDLMSHSFSYRSFLDQTSVNGFIRDRFYRTERVALQHQELLLKGISVPSYAVSAMTMRNVLRFWLRYPRPMHRILRGNLQQFWIDPIHQRLERLGVRTFLHHRLERIHFEVGRVGGVDMVLAGGGSQRIETERLLVAIPWEKLAGVLDDDAYEAVPDLFRIRKLHSCPMAALNIYFRNKVPGLQRAHTSLLEGRLGLSFIDVSQWWKGYEDRTVLNVISCEFTTLESVSQDVAVGAILDELIAFVPVIRREDIERIDYQPHLDEPLFMNEVGAWRDRPSARTTIPNLYLAGDYCRSHIDLVSMEGAVSTGLLAAEAIRQDLGIDRAVDVLEPDTVPRWLLRVAYYLGLPIAAILRLVTLIQGTGTVASASAPTAQRR